MTRIMGGDRLKEARNRHGAGARASRQEGRGRCEHVDREKKVGNARLTCGKNTLLGGLQDQLFSKVLSPSSLGTTFLSCICVKRTLGQEP